jgi:hypothetical protein
MLSDWVSFLAYPNLFGIKGFVVFVDSVTIWTDTRIYTQKGPCVAPKVARLSLRVGVSFIGVEV